MGPALSENIVGHLLVFAGIGFSVLMGVGFSSISRRTANTDGTPGSRWYLRAVGGLVFATPFYLFGTLAIVVYIGFYWSPVLIAAYWAVLVGTLLVIAYLGYFILNDLFNAAWDYWTVRKVNKDNGIS